jgi:hypothetical protein
MTRHPNPEAATGSKGTTSNGGAAAQCQQEKAQQQKKQQISSRLAKLHSRSINNNERRSPGKLRLRSSCNLRIINGQNNSLFNSRSIDNSRRSTGKLRLSSSCNMRISNRRNSNLSSLKRRSAGNLPLSSRCNKYNSLYNRRSLGNLHCKRGTRPGNLCIKMRFLTVLMGQNRTNQNTSLVHLCC